MQINYEILPEIFLYTTTFFVIYFLLYREYIYSILDPLFIYVFTISFSSVLVIYVLEDRLDYLLHFFLCQVFLFFGFALTFRWLRNISSLALSTGFPTRFFDYETLRTVVYLLFVFYTFANIVLFYTTGFALFSDEPTMAKVENFTKGFGIILKINWGVGGFLISALIFFILCEARWINFLLLSIAVLFTALEGSKSSLLRILITLLLLLNHPLFSHKKSVIGKMKWLVPFGILAVLSISFTVLFKENADTEQALFAFVRRLLYGADSTLFFYSPVNEQYFARYHFWDYFSHIINPILGFLRVVPYNEAFGNVMVANNMPTMTGTIVGPNTPHYIEGQVFFGYYGAFIYSAVIGSSYAFIRQYFFQSKYYSAFWLVLMCSLCQQASALNVEVTLFVTQAFDTCFFVVPVYVFVSFMMNGKLRLRKLHF